MNNERPLVLITGLISDMPSADAALIEGTLEALYQAELVDVLRELVRRVLGPVPTAESDDREARLVDEQYRLRPFVDLLLREIQFAATVKGWTPEMRIHYAMTTIVLAGF